MLRIIGKLLVLTLSIFATFLGICAVIGIQIYFPFNIAEGEEIPYHRMQSIRVAVFITFAFYSALYLINSIKEVYPIHFLKVFMISFGITSLVFSYQAEAGMKEIILAIFYLCCGLVFHLISKPAIKKYFN
tara:strand:- start:57 stop:449 length:393 start_codon:yes stop_codon:yes gene_type:complete